MGPLAGDGDIDDAPPKRSRGTPPTPQKPEMITPGVGGTGALSLDQQTAMRGARDKTAVAEELLRQQFRRQTPMGGYVK